MTNTVECISQTRFDPVQYRYTDQFSPISENSANLLICNYFFLLQPSLSFALLTQTQHLTQRLKIPHRKVCRFDSGPAIIQRYVFSSKTPLNQAGGWHKQMPK